MELGMFVDFCVEWNEANDPEHEKKNKDIQRKATQYDWNILLG